MASTLTNGEVQEQRLFKFVVRYNKDLKYSFQLPEHQSFKSPIIELKKLLNQSSLIFKHGNFVLNEVTRPETIGAIDTQRFPDLCAVNNTYRVDSDGTIHNIIEAVSVEKVVSILVKVKFADYSMVTRVTKTSRVEQLFALFRIFESSFKTQISSGDTSNENMNVIQLENFKKTFTELNIRDNDELELLRDETLKVFIRHVPYIKVDGPKRIEPLKFSFTQPPSSDKKPPSYPFLKFDDLSTLRKSSNVVVSNKLKDIKKTETASESPLEQKSKQVKPIKPTEQKIIEPTKLVKQKPISKIAKIPACVACRKRKIGCDRNLPCSSCKIRQVECDYGSSSPFSNSPPSQPSLSEVNGNSTRQNASNIDMKQYQTKTLKTVSTSASDSVIASNVEQGGTDKSVGLTDSKHTLDTGISQKPTLHGGKNGGEKNILKSIVNINQSEPTKRIKVNPIIQNNNMQEQSIATLQMKDSKINTEQNAPTDTNDTKDFYGKIRPELLHHKDTRDDNGISSNKAENGDDDEDVPFALRSKTTEEANNKLLPDGEDSVRKEEPPPSDDIIYIYVSSESESDDN
jgi:hypothetical protein